MNAKAELFREECFPPPPWADLADIENYRYRAQLTTDHEVSEEEVLVAVGKTKSGKALGPDGITNRVAKLLLYHAKGSIRRLFLAF